MLSFKPEARKTWESSKKILLSTLMVRFEDVIIDESIAKGIKILRKQKRGYEGAMDSDTCIYCS